MMWRAKISKKGLKNLWFFYLYESSMVGSYSSTKWFWISCIVRALFPTPPAKEMTHESLKLSDNLKNTIFYLPPTTTNLYSVIFWRKCIGWSGWKNKSRGFYSVLLPIDPKLGVKGSQVFEQNLTGTYFE